ncbi:MAG: ADP-heptose--LPS heptosyltransferase 2 [Chlamydiae bacterium]|nr:ADP-heptose--LPS heptosyltransferase 2 [Chlamydiota bacterium]
MKERDNKTLRFLDRYLGILLVALFRFFKRKCSLSQKISSIALLKSAGIGDTALLSAIVLDLQQAFPEAKIIFFTGTSNREMAEMIPGIEVVSLPMVSPWRALQLIRHHRFDLWLDFDPWPRISALFGFFSRAAYTIGFKTARQGRHFLYDRSVEHKSDVHALENCRNLLKPLDIHSHHQPKISVEVSEPKKRVVCHLFPGGSRAALKMWPEKKWSELVVFLASEGYEVVLTGGKGDRERLPPLPGVQNVAGELSLREVAELLKSSSCVISVDTGIMHLAAVIGAPLIALHGPTSPDRWGGIGEKVVAITPKLNCRPCIYLGFESKCSVNRCMQAISVEQVKEAFLELVNT